MPQLDPAAKELEEKVDSVETRIDRLRSLYEQYFQGIERLEPNLERDAVKRLLQEMKTTSVRNTGLRFRINQLVAKFTTYEIYWTRIVRQMEDGTYGRDVFKARYHMKLREEHDSSKGQPQDGATAPAPEKRAGEEPAYLTEAHVTAIYDAYTTAKRRCKESTQGITMEALASTLRKQVPAIIRQYKCKSVEFKVVIKEGKAILKAVPKF
jgi:hypothetical protein